jgi:VWFA-related protein
MRNALLAVLSLLAAFTLSAQKIGETVLVQVVEVPVTVVGSDGKPVRGLTRADFELFDEGKKIPIDYFEMVDMKALAAGKDASAPPAIATRNFLLLFDLANSAPGTVGRAGAAAKEFVVSQLGPRDLAAVATMTAEEGLKVVTSFTSDRKMLTAAIESLGDPRYFKVADPLMISFKDTSSLTAAAMDVATASTERQRFAAERQFEKMAAREELLDPTLANKARQQSSNTEARNRLRIQLDNMGAVARMLDRLHGRKQVILLSEGFDPTLVRGQETRTDAAQQEEDRKRMLGEVWSLDSDQRFGSGIAARDVGEMVQVFRRSDVVLHAIDIKGLRGNSDAASSGSAASKSNESLFMLTRPTGGTVFQNSNDFTDTFARMLEQQEVVYLLGFRATGGANPGGFHDLKVKTSARGARVSHRAGYFEPSPYATNLEKTLSTAEILLTDAPLRDIDVRISATTIPGPDGKARVPVFVEIDGASFLEGLFGTNATANLFIYAFDAKNNVHDYLTQRISLDLTTARDALSNGLRYFGTLRLEPGEYAVKVVARVEDSNRAGFVRTNVRVPEFGRPTVLQPFILDDVLRWATLAGPTRGDDYQYPFAAGDQTYVPRGRNVLRASDEYRIALLAYDVELENANLAPTIVDANGVARPATVTVVGRTPKDSWNGTKLLLAFKPEGLAPGNYELRLGVKPQSADESRFALPFTIE